MVLNSQKSNHNQPGLTIRMQLLGFDGTTWMGPPGENPGRHAVSTKKSQFGPSTEPWWACLCVHPVLDWVYSVCHLMLAWIGSRTLGDPEHNKWVLNNGWMNGWAQVRWTTQTWWYLWCLSWNLSTCWIHTGTISCQRNLGMTLLGSGWFVGFFVLPFPIVKNWVMDFSPFHVFVVKFCGNAHFFTYGSCICTLPMVACL